ncbi:hypothetical protein [Shewanella halotolerans]|uniref:hypothetical protein n=1 Tax=Shewanella halotolerans TaxID=2864204 RepID=UPI001C65509B|nr:hypothetical protein [Shewanella halotolerans]QYJ88479.1 hypothetical protein K0H81_11690 [Shewanella halotolerans]
MNSQSNSYFSVAHGFAAYLSPWPKEQPLPDDHELRSMLPLGMQLISEVKAMEADCLLQLRHLDDEARTVVDYLKLQSRKIDLVLQHVLEQQPHEGERCNGLHFGGSGIHLQSPTKLVPGERYRITLHIREALIAILCIGECTRCDDEASEGGFNCELSFIQILDEDVEQLVKASLNIQQKQLQQRKKQQQDQS